MSTRTQHTQRLASLPARLAMGLSGLGLALGLCLPGTAAASSLMVSPEHSRSVPTDEAPTRVTLIQLPTVYVTAKRIPGMKKAPTAKAVTPSAAAQPAAQAGKSATADQPQVQSARSGRGNSGGQS